MNESFDVHVAVGLLGLMDRVAEGWWLMVVDVQEGIVSCVWILDGLETQVNLSLPDSTFCVGRGRCWLMGLDTHYQIAFHEKTLPLCHPYRGCLARFNHRSYAHDPFPCQVASFNVPEATEPPAGGWHAIFV